LGNERGIPHKEEGVSGRLRDLVLLVYAIGATGVAVDLIALGHFRDLRQLVPLVVLISGLLVLAWQRLRQNTLATRCFQVAMVLLVASGFLGLLFHASRNVGFAVEMNPMARLWEVARSSVAGPTPSLAPATLIQLGLLGLIHTYRHPLLRRADK